MQLFVPVQEYQSFGQGLFFFVIQSDLCVARMENVIMQSDIGYALF